MQIIGVDLFQRCRRGFRFIHIAERKDGTQQHRLIVIDLIRFVSGPCLPNGVVNHRLAKNAQCLAHLTALEFRVVQVFPSVPC